MTTSQPPDFHLNRPGVLIAALPAVLGFVPEKSLVLVTVDRGEMGCVMRVDLSDDLLHSLEHVADVAAAARPDSAIAVVVDEEGCDLPDVQRRISSNWPTVLTDRAGRARASNCSPRTSSTGSPPAGGGIAPTAAATQAPSRTRRRRRWPWPRSWTAAGSTPGAPSCKKSSRSSIPPAPPRWPRSSATANRMRRSAPDAEARADIEDGHRRGRREWPTAAGLGDDELARLAWALTDLRVRDTLYALAVGENAGQAESLWAVLSRTLPEPWRVEALVLLAFSAYARGDGPLAGVSLEAALRCDPTHRMAGMLDTALQSGHAARDRSAIWPITGLPAGRSAGRAVTADAGVRPACRIALLASDLFDLHGVRHVVGQLDLLVAGDHDHDAAVVVGLARSPWRWAPRRRP